MKKKINLVFLLLLMITISGCALFRKKNRCDDCPSWGKIEVVKKQSQRS